MPPETLTPAQREKAIRNVRRATKIRSHRAKVKRELANGKADLRRLLTDPPAYARGAKVRDLLTAVPGIGQKKADRLMLRVAPSSTHSKRVGDLSQRQRIQLLESLGLSPEEQRR